MSANESPYRSAPALERSGQESDEERWSRLVAEVNQLTERLNAGELWFDDPHIGYVRLKTEIANRSVLLDRLRLKIIEDKVDAILAKLDAIASVLPDPR